MTDYTFTFPAIAADQWVTVYDALGRSVATGRASLVGGSAVQTFSLDEGTYTATVGGIDNEHAAGVADDATIASLALGSGAAPTVPTGVASAEAASGWYGGDIATPGGYGAGDRYLVPIFDPTVETADIWTEADCVAAENGRFVIQRSGLYFVVAYAGFTIAAIPDPLEGDMAGAIRVYLSLVEKDATLTGPVDAITPMSWTGPTLTAGSDVGASFNMPGGLDKARLIGLPAGYALVPGVQWGAAEGIDATTWLEIDLTPVVFFD